MDDPVQLISTGRGGTDFQINEAAVKLLEKETRPVSVICVVGPYRTGKSYLLNRIKDKTAVAGAGSDGFALGANVEAATKGIWMWIGDFFGDPARALILLDTEGLDDPDKGDSTHDMTLFTLSLMLSSVFVYNTKGTIDAKSLDGLRYAAEISDYLSADSGDCDAAPGKNLAQHFPELIWAVRDHHLRLEIEGRAVTATEYLEFCLRMKKGTSARVAAYNALREALRSFFPSRRCCIFPPPVNAPDKMLVLDRLLEADLEPAFVRAGNVFLDEVRKAKPKSIQGTPLNGRSFAFLAEQVTNVFSLW